MKKIEIGTGIVHEVPEDLKITLIKNLDLLVKWNSLTPIARNEWICWITITKKQKTRYQHIVRLCEDLRKGNKRPCCWPGCPHRRENAKKWFKSLNRKNNHENNTRTR